jgi:hypothetical protein
MKLVLMILTVLSTSASFADIRRVNPDIDTRTVTGEAAEHLMQTMGGQSLPGSSLRTSHSTYQVKRESDGLKQIICEATTSNITGKTDYRCTIETSLNGEPVPVFKPVIRLG